MIWFYSDPHFYHNNVIRYCSRPHATVEEMNEDLVRRWNTVVRPEDTVYCLGDFSMAFRAVELFSPRLMGNKVLVPGNHDFCHSYHKKSRKPDNRAEWIKKYEKNGWTVLPERTTLELEGIGVVNLCHHPYPTDGADDQYDDKYAKWRPVDDGKVLLCGHVHEKWQTRLSQAGTLMVNVGVDVWDYAPVSLETLKETVNKFR